MPDYTSTRVLFYPSTLPPLLPVAPTILPFYSSTTLIFYHISILHLKTYVLGAVYPSALLPFHVVALLFFFPYIFLPSPLPPCALLPFNASTSSSSPLPVYSRCQYRKFVCDPGDTYHDVPQQFFHFSFLASNGRSIIWDLQGVHAGGQHQLTDPFLVETERPSPFGDPRYTLARLHDARKCGQSCRHGMAPWHVDVIVVVVAVVVVIIVMVVVVIVVGVVNQTLRRHQDAAAMVLQKSLNVAHGDINGLQIPGSVLWTHKSLASEALWYEHYRATRCVLERTANRHVPEFARDCSVSTTR